ncbi:MAG: apolipoprotein N-acyltransferase [Candidatus Binatia bacterium]|nr:apolipoprotein N-acyltransferase [Candidatus Binatia bacterium]HAC80609.1 apolipoprotein N-acyltransferase [Deltaproteobacteria bacterium]
MSDELSRVPSSRWWNDWVLVSLSIALHAVAFPPWDQPLAAWVALAPLLLALRQKAPARAFLLGFVWGTGSIWAQGYWVPLGIAYYYDQTLLFGLLFSLVASIVFYATYAAAFALAAARLPIGWSAFPRACGLGMIFVTAEWARASLLTGDPWLLLGYALVPGLGFAQIADLGGVYILSFFLVLANAALVECWVGFPQRSGVRLKEALSTLALAVLIPGVYGVWRLLNPVVATETIPVAIVQTNQDLGSHWQEEFYGRGLRDYFSLSEKAVRAGAEFLFWPEGSVNFFVADDPNYRAAVEAQVAAWDVDLILGGPFRDLDDSGVPSYRNSAFYLEPENGLVDRYDKHRLLPFGEYFPLEMIRLLRRFERVRSFTPGEGPSWVDTDRGRMAISICFEAIFPDEVRRQMNAGAKLLVNLSNDAWLGPGAGPSQHLLMVRLRAIENRTWVVRATPTGISALINPYGSVERELERGEAGFLSGDVGLLSVATPYQRYGDVFALVCALGSGAFLLNARFRRFQRRGSA